MALFTFPLDQVVLFLMVLVRVAAILFVVPFFDSRNVPILLKISLAVAVAWLLLPQLDTPLRICSVRRYACFWALGARSPLG
jgi:flagellar biosynthesis protein FliR